MTHGWTTYAQDPAWQAIEAAMPPASRPGAEASVVEEWRRIGAFDVHIDRWAARGRPRGRLVMVHGGGGHGRLLAPFAVLGARAGLEAVAPDLPGYGLTRVPKKAAIRYEDWRATLATLIRQEAAGGLPVFVFGLSMGGLLAYDATARTGLPAGLIATCFLDARRAEVRRGVVRWPWMGPLVGPLFALTPPLLEAVPFPMALGGNMKAIANDPALTRAIVRDRKAGGNWMPVGFLKSWMTAAPEVPPDRFATCPALLAHPAEDRWTDVEISRPFFDALTVEKELRMLTDGGHAPVEPAAMGDLEDALERFVARCLERGGQAGAAVTEKAVG